MPGPIVNEARDRTELARLSLEGLSVGDAFGETFFIDPNEALRRIQDRDLRDGPWRLTDDSIMACGVFSCLRDNQEIQENSLSRFFARNYEKDPARGYGAGAHRLLRRIATDNDWFRHSTNLFRGEGSFGNGGAMRSAPVGAYFFDDLEKVVSHAKKSAIVTHGHKEGQAGAVAIAIAAALATLHSGDAEKFRESMYEACLEFTPSGEVRDGIERARNTPATSSIELAHSRLGNGKDISAMDTVPFTLWASHRHIDDYPEALWTTVAALGDRDTTCAIVGGIVSLFVGEDGIPQDWRDRREPIEDWI